MLKLTITSIRAPIGTGPGQVMARNATDQAVQIAVTKKDWALLEAAAVAIGDTVEYAPQDRTWKRVAP